ncbi:MAG TPA: hypothetical protein VNI78_06925 [Vicinamibacterales bacterium]|nr:hypothetical protein [Vicinamibacterales bacterium]
MPISLRRMAWAAALAAATAAAGCGELATAGRSPVQLVINALEAAPGGTSSPTFGTMLLSDVTTLRRSPAPCSDASPCPTVFNDVGRVTLSLVLKDPGVPGVTLQNPTAVNQVTITRYRVEYRRADGRNTPGVDVPYDFDSAITITVPATGTVQAGFELVRHSAKQEAPLRALAVSGSIISTITRVTFFGRDQAGHDVSASGTIGINFGDFADPE